MSTTSISASCDSLQLRESEVTMHMWRPLRLIKADWGEAAGGSAPGIELLAGVLCSGKVSLWDFAVIYQFKPA